MKKKKRISEDCYKMVQIMKHELSIQKKEFPKIIEIQIMKYKLSMKKKDITPGNF